MEPLVGAAGDLTPRQAARYARHLALPQVGAEGQRRVANARVLCIGAGGLGSPVALYLAAAGVGQLDVIDDDIVSESNLQRQIIHTTDGVGTPKAESAAAALRQLNPLVAVGALRTRLDAANALAVVSGYDLVIDGTDTFDTRYLINDACVIAGVPYVFASVLRFAGYVMAVVPGRSACYRCAFPTPPPAGSQPTCEQAGVFGAMCGMLGSIQAMEALKLVVGAGEPLVDRLLRVDALTMTSDVLHISRDPECTVCGERPAIDDTNLGAVLSAADDDSKDGAMTPPEVTAVQLRTLLDQRRSGAATFTLLDVREPFEAEICSLDGAVLIPQGDVPTSPDIAGWERAETVIVMCRSGVRSAAVCDHLRARGFADVRNLAGGILGWIDDVDSSLTRY